MEFIIKVKIDDEKHVDVDVKMIEEEEEKEPVSMYGRWFDDECFPAWKNDPTLNLLVLKATERHFNELLMSRGHVYLNEVYDMLKMHGAEIVDGVGWFKDETSTTRDNWIDFDIYAQRNYDFLNGYENRILLDFNVDGYISDLVENKEKGL